MKVRIPATLGVVGCLVVGVLMVAVSFGITALITLGVHWILPQFDYWKEFVAVYIIAVLLGSIGNKR